MQRTHFTAGYTLYNCVCDKINNSSSTFIQKGIKVPVKTLTLLKLYL